MRNLKVGHVVEAGIWLALAAFLYAYSFQFEREIEIYRFGAVAWPRAILALIAIAALGQLAYHWRGGGQDNSAESADSVDNPTNNLATSADNAADSADNSPVSSQSPAVPAAGINMRAHLAVCFLLALPFVYMTLPGALQAWFGVDKTILHGIKLISAGALIAAYVAVARRHQVGAMLALPIFFGALLEDFGFYATAPVFVLGVMYLMGERRYRPMAQVAALIVGLIFLLFVSVLYVGLPLGNLSPFYEFGAAVVTLLQ